MPRLAKIRRPAGCFYRVTLAGIFLSLLPPVARAARERVDTDAVLAIDSFTVSAYRVEKNYRRFAQASGMPGGTAAAPEEIRARFSRFLDQQMIIFAALRAGYGERPEVVSEVARMTQHMLTQYEGPFYEHLYAGQRQPEPDWSALYPRLRHGYDVVILRFDATAPAAASIDPTPGANQAATWNEMVARLKASGEADVYEGVVAWPYQPCIEIGADIETAAPGTWATFRHGRDLFICQVRQVVSGNPPPLASIKPQLFQAWQRAEKARIQAARRADVLERCQFSLAWPAAERVALLLGASAPNNEDLAGLRSLVLATYQSPQGPVNVTVDDYCAYRDARYVRSHAPVGLARLLAEVQALVVARHDFAEAINLGIDRDAKFTEDRENYRNYTALDLYERERLRPSLPVTDSLIEQYYREHAANYARPTRVEGVLSTFEREVDARAAVRDPQLSTAPRSSETLVLAMDSVVPGMTYLPAMVLASIPAQPVLGPLPCDGGFAVWKTRKILKQDLPPLHEVSAAIRAVLEQPLLEQREAIIARELARDHQVQDRIDYQKYALSAAPEKPWMQ